MPSLIEAIRAGLAATGTAPAPHTGDEDVAGHGLSLASQLPIPAAVLMALVDRPEPGLILTRRTGHLRTHAGQVAFPGGRIDPEDDGPIAAALREAEEEIALPRSEVDVMGISSSWHTVTGYRVDPVVGLVPPGLPLRPASDEVADLFEVPLGHVLDRRQHQLREADWKGARRRFYVIEWRDRTIWGATAGMLVNLAARLG